MAAPNRQLPPLPNRESGHRWPVNDTEAKAAGLQKVVRLSDNQVEYHHSIDCPELEASGAYRWERWV